jgi:hypothetical protein
MDHGGDPPVFRMGHILGHSTYQGSVQALVELAKIGRGNGVIL